MTKESLTNESLKGICNSNFALAHFGIALGRYFISSGREPHLRDVVKEMKRHPDPNYVDVLRQIDEQEENKEPEQQYPE
ncbi:MAG: hypothetical protein KR126chlam1_00707 [Chlamydiae bacterium]|nr:hypothetical protein [Chlamydiota bacterium]